MLTARLPFLRRKRTFLFQLQPTLKGNLSFSKPRKSVLAHLIQNSLLRRWLQSEIPKLLKKDRILKLQPNWCRCKSKTRSRGPHRNRYWRQRSITWTHPVSSLSARVTSPWSTQLLQTTGGSSFLKRCDLNTKQSCRRQTKHRFSNMRSFAMRGSLSEKRKSIMSELVWTRAGTTIKWNN